MKLLVVGSGGREHALVWKLKKSEHVSKIFWAPGNGGAENSAETLSVSAESVQELKDFAVSNKIDLVVIGPEAPLTLGLVDILENEGLKAFGPSKKAAQLESSKIFTKEFCRKYSIPTSNFWIFSGQKNADDFLNSSEAKFPIVLKADGLAAGKGVIIAQDLEEARFAVNKIMVEKAFGDAGNRLLIEEFLTGEEASVMALCDGENSLLLPTARDYKRAYDGDKGPNTGGMGSISPSPLLSDKSLSIIQKAMIDRTLKGMAKEGNPFKGLLYAGIMITEEGPKLLEFNARFGDPETQAVLPRIEGDLFELLYSASQKKLARGTIETNQRTSVSVVAASKGYPGRYEKEFEIGGIEKAEKSGAMVFHAGTKVKEGKLLTNGGRVLNVTALGGDIAEAREKAYRALSYIKFEGLTFRSDIALKATERI